MPVAKLMFTILMILVSLDILNLNDYGPQKNNRSHRYFLVVIDSFSNFGWAVVLKKKNVQTIKDSFENILINSKRKPNSIETDRGKEFLNKIFTNLLNSIKRYSRYTSVGAVFGERFNCTFRDLL